MYLLVCRGWVGARACRYPQRPKEGARSLRDGVTDCEPPDVCAGIELGSSARTRSTLTAEPSFLARPCPVFMWCWIQLSPGLHAHSVSTSPTVFTGNFHLHSNLREVLFPPPSLRKPRHTLAVHLALHSSSWRSNVPGPSCPCHCVLSGPVSEVLKKQQGPNKQ